ncbi:hypothetical protein QMY49_06290 [Vibrio harveyi]|nr:hypothetical protein [Vibrio harveyi]WHP64129.1 hypothetical protein QMY49_06290 [Vibrio harveyi]
MDRVILVLCKSLKLKERLSALFFCTAFWVMTELVIQVEQSADEECHDGNREEGIHT